MKILKILGIAAGLHAFALILIFSNPGCTYTKAGAPDAPPVTDAPVTPPAGGDAATIRYSPTRPGTVVASALEAEPVSGVTPVTTYSVVRGDNLWSIAKANQISRTDLAAANKLGANSTLHVGQKLVIPTKAKLAAPAAALPAPAPSSGVTAAPAGVAAPEKPAVEAEKHVVKAGETLGGIARKYGVRQGDIAVANNITDPRKIQPGQELVIPARSASAGGKQSKVAKAKGDGGAPAGETKAPTGGSGGEQDLDAGLKPASGAEVPVVKIEENPPAQQPKNP